MEMLFFSPCCPFGRFGPFCAEEKGQKNGKDDNDNKDQKLKAHLFRAIIDVMRISAVGSVQVNLKRIIRVHDFLSFGDQFRRAIDDHQGTTLLHLLFVIINVVMMDSPATHRAKESAYNRASDSSS